MNGGIIHPPVAFTQDDAERAHDEWGANCGPGALAGVLGITLDAVRQHMGDFEAKRYTNPTMMRAALRHIGADWRDARRGATDWPPYGVARVQWEGSWTNPGVPAVAAYRHTHWVGAKRGRAGVEVFDINCMSVGGWVALEIWTRSLVPWLLAACEPKASGGWFLTHAMDIAVHARPDA